MISKVQIKFIQSLHQKNERIKNGFFLVEGDKTVRELLNSNIEIIEILATSEWENPFNLNFIKISEDILKQISTHKNPNQVLAIAKIPTFPMVEKLAEKLYLICDGINDPGNAGTIIRTADWFGIEAIFWSPNSVDIYNSKVVSAAKGSLFRTQHIFTDLPMLISQNRNLKTYGTTMNGGNIYSQKLPNAGFVILGNEANGISDNVLSLIDEKITIPNFGKAESLNVGVACGIILSEFSKNKFF